MKIYNKYFVCLLAILLAGCKKKKKVTSTASTTLEVENTGAEEVEFVEKSVEETAEAMEESMSEEAGINLKECSVYYGYDRDTISQTYFENVEKLAEWLSQNNVTIVIYGNCDQRGSASYNVGLGSRRANAVKKALVSKGISANRIIAVSTGQEIIVSGTSEEAYAKNRVARIEVKGEGSNFESKSKNITNDKSSKTSVNTPSEIEDNEDDEDDDN